VNGWTGYVVDEGLVKRLRDEADGLVAGNDDNQRSRALVAVLREAADRIVRLNAERFCGEQPRGGEAG
jgi:hypothetical protein